jgi:hypothetical protein
MPTRLVLSGIAVLALIAMSCGINIDLPVDRIITGETVTEDINIPAPAAGEVELELSFGAGEFDLRGGGGSALVSGTATYNVEDFKPEVDTRSDRVTMRTGDLEITGIPNLEDDVINHWDLQLGDLPMQLKISAGAFEGDFDLGGVALTRLEVRDGASDVRLDFSSANPAEMDRFTYSTGASNVRLTGLGNANFETMLFRSGLGNYTLDFSGDLRRNADVTVESGVSQVTIVAPEGVSARVEITGGLNNVDFSGGWDQSGSAYVLGTGQGPVLTFNVEMGAGNLQLRTN